jgi:hypothetical protein
MRCSPRRPWSRAPDFRLEDNLAVEKLHWVFETLSTAKDYAQLIYAVACYVSFIEEPNA